MAGKLYLGKYMGPFLAVFASTRLIEELDISGNQIGDEGMEMLAEALRMNKVKQNDLFFFFSFVFSNGFFCFLDFEESVLG